MATIAIRIHRFAQLFSSLDASPFHERTLNQDAETYIVDRAEAYGSKEPLQIVIRARPKLLPGNPKTSRMPSMHTFASRTISVGAGIGLACASEFGP